MSRQAETPGSTVFSNFFTPDDKNNNKQALSQLPNNASNGFKQTMQNNANSNSPSDRNEKSNLDLLKELSDDNSTNKHENKHTRTVKNLTNNSFVINANGAGTNFISQIIEQRPEAQGCKKRKHNATLQSAGPAGHVSAPTQRDRVFGKAAKTNLFGKARGVHHFK